MARQSTTPVSFNRTTRVDTSAIMTSGRAGLVNPILFIPLLRGDSASGTVGIDIELGEMPRPLLNGVVVNAQAWFMPKSAHPQFFSEADFRHSYQGELIKALGQADRTPPPFFHVLTGAAKTQYLTSTFIKMLGIHVPDGVTSVNADLIDAYNIIYNFRLAAHSSKLERRKYATENLTDALKLARAFWPSNRYSRVVPDYERALLLGALTLDVAAGQVPVKGIGFNGNVNGTSSANREGPSGTPRTTQWHSPGAQTAIAVGGAGATSWPAIYAEMAGMGIDITLSNFDKARTTQAFAKVRTAYAGNDATGFDNDDVIVAELMQGLRVPEEVFKRPWLLDSKMVNVGFIERHATDAENLDRSLTQGRTSLSLRINVPVQDVGGLVMVTVEVLPERLYERQSEGYVMLTDPAQFPDALRDVQRIEPVDLVPNHRIDAKHTAPNSLYGYEPMNDVWNREYTRLGGAFYQATPGAAWTEQRSALWLPEIVDPEYTDAHYLAPDNFPHDVFSDTNAPAYELTARHSVTIVGLTQIGDVLVENNDDYEAVVDA